MPCAIPSEGRGHRFESCRVRHLHLQKLAGTRAEQTVPPRTNSVHPAYWESTTPYYTRWITDSKYQKIWPECRKWYRPICPKCGPTSPKPPSVGNTKG
jgi:hypothetical protein